MCCFVVVKEHAAQTEDALLLPPSDMTNDGTRSDREVSAVGIIYESQQCRFHVDKTSTIVLHSKTQRFQMSPLRHSRLRGQELSKPGAAPKAGCGGLPAGNRVSSQLEGQTRQGVRGFAKPAGLRRVVKTGLRTGRSSSIELIRVLASETNLGTRNKKPSEHAARKALPRIIVCNPRLW